MNIRSFYTKISAILMAFIIFVCSSPKTLAHEEKTYAFSPEPEILFTLFPSSQKVLVEVSNSWLAKQSADFGIYALYLDGKMLTCKFEALNDNASIAVELLYTSALPPECVLFATNTEYAPLTEAKRCNMYTQALCVEDGTYSYWMEYSEINALYTSKLEPLEKELTELNQAIADSNAKIIQAELDLVNLPTKENSYIRQQISYYMSIGVGGSVYARQKAEKDWENYKTSQTAKLNSTIILENQAIATYNEQAVAQRSKIDALTSQHNQDISTLRAKYPNAKTDGVGGTYETDNYTYNESLELLTIEYNRKVMPLQERILQLEAYTKQSQDNIVCANLELTSLPTQETSYIRQRIDYYMDVGVGGSEYARQSAEKDWNDYYTQKTAEYNAVIVKENTNINMYSEEIDAIKSTVAQYITHYNTSVANLKLRYGIE